MRLLYLTIVCFAFSTICNNALFAQSIRLNQLGFYVNGPKKAVITGNISSRRFYLIKHSTGDTVYTGTLQPALRSQYSSAITRIADFSVFHTQGQYVLYVKEAGNSYPFTITSNSQHPVAVAALKGYYYQRVSMPLEAKYAAQWARPAGHADTAVIVHASAASPQRPAGTVISSSGGWYDAGDYNKYIVNSGITMGTLLSAYEDFSYYFDTLITHIPESSDGVPDILNEIIYNLRWMLSMQDPYDGGVYNKCTNAAFDGMVMPGVTKLPRYVVQKGTAATLDFAAVMAQAARIFKKFGKELPGLSDTCLAAAEKAWQWAKQYPALEYDQNKMNSRFEPKITTGGYGDKNFSDEWFWAACELFVTTNNKKYLPVIQQHINDAMNIPSWGNVHMLGCYTLLRNNLYIQKEGGISLELLKQHLLVFASNIINHGDTAFNTIMGQSKADFVWGSNAVALNQSIFLINTYFIERNERYIHYALENLDYVLGRNATGFCFVTGIGYKSPEHPHHRPSIADGIKPPVPGLLAGGPNPGQQDHCAGYPSQLPAGSYVDDACSYASNEIAINWNAPLVYVANALEALQYKIGYSKRNLK
jgi:endoglucanase